MTSPSALLIAAAVPAELNTIIAHLSEKKEIHQGPLRIHTGTLFEHHVAALVTGPGNANMAGSLGTALGVLQPRAVLLTGCGGAFGGTGLFMGDIALATEEVHGQLGVEDGERPGWVHPLAFLENRAGLDQLLTRKVHHALLGQRGQKKFKVFKGPFLTVATVTTRQATASFYRDTYHPLMENMEGFAAATLCNRHKTPLVELRAVSNMVGQEDRNTWRLKPAFERSQETVLNLIERGVL